MVFNIIIDIIVAIVCCLILFLLWSVKLPLGNGASFPTSSPQEFVIYLITLPALILLLYIIGSYILGLIFWDLEVTGGIILLILGIAIVGIVLICYYLYSKEDKEAREELNKKLNEKSVNTNDEYLINKILNLKPVKRYYLCKIYNIRNKDEDIIKFMSDLNNGNPWNENELYFFLNEIPESEPLYDYYNNPPKQIKQKIMSRDNNKCRNCGKSLFNNGELFIIKDADDGGTLTEDNLLAICKECNSKLFTLRAFGWDSSLNHQAMFRDKYVCQNCGKQLYDPKLETMKTEFEDYLNTGEFIDEDGLLKYHIENLERGDGNIFYKKRLFEDGFPTKNDIITVCPDCKKELERKRTR